jgi:hypothetical protein
MKPSPRGLGGRDQAVSPFAAILMRLCDGTGAVGAALVDREGETVDYAGRVDPYEIKVAAAEWRLVLSVLAQSRIPNWNATRELVVRAGRRSFAAVLLDDGYALVAQLPVHCFSLSPRALAECERDLCREAGFAIPAAAARLGGRWTRVDVRPSAADRRRPSAVWHGGSWLQLEILGRYAKAELGRGEMGYRARMPSGAEITLVRERLGLWYAEDLPDAAT